MQAIVFIVVRFTRATNVAGNKLRIMCSRWFSHNRKFCPK